MIKILNRYIFVLLLILSQFAWGQAEYYGGYLHNFKYLSNTKLRKTLNKIISQSHVERVGLPDLIGKKYAHYPRAYKHIAHSYKNAVKKLVRLNSTRPTRNTLSIKTIYCEGLFVEIPPSGSGRSPVRIAKRKHYNTEHVWPQSLFENEGKMISQRRFQVSDLHHLFMSSEYINGIRGNYQFAEVVIKSDVLSEKRLVRLNEKIGDNKIGMSKLEGADPNIIYFEPRDNDKGTIARSIMYFALRYNLPIPPTLKHFVIKWHKKFKVTDKEKIYNNEVEKFQFNRNPFIDYPELARIFE